MNDIAAVRQAVDRVLLGDLEPILDLLSEDVVFQVAVGGDEPVCLEESGREAVVDYFSALGGLVSFWQLDYTAGGEQLIAWGKESFTVERCGIEGECEFALVFELAEGRITRFLVIEDLPSYIRQSHLSMNFFRPPSIMPQLDSEWARASSVGLLSWVSETGFCPPLPPTESSRCGSSPAGRAGRRAG
jgi:ketosteroid isomerase-like protein